MPELPGTWSEVEVAGHPCDVYEPPEMNPHGYVVIYLHGVHVGRLPGNEAFTREFARHGLPVLGPITQRSWWTDRICEEFDPHVSAEEHVLGGVVPYVQRRWETAPPRIGLLGTSMGGQGALRFAFKHPDTFPVVAALAPAIDYQHRFDEGDETLPVMYRDSEEARQDTATLHVHPLYWPRSIFFSSDPTDWRWHESAERLRMKLYSLGIPHECDLETEAGGHGFQYYNHMAAQALQFIIERLEHERLRV